MSERKKDSAGKTTDKRLDNPAPGKSARTPEGLRVVVSSRSGAAAVPQEVSADQQLQVFESAMKLFHARKFREARELFLQAAGGPERDVAHRAQLHASMCERRLQQPPVELHTAEDYYNYGVALLNSRNVEEGWSHLERALQLAPAADHIHYALAVAQALRGANAEALEHLRRAIELEPKNRLMARQDADFGSLNGQPQFQALLYPEKKNW
jgi:tetratricopeptide (TPR) repeat protein